MEKQGNLKLEYVSAVTDELRDLEVYLLEARKKHILEHHPEAKDLLDLLPDVLEHPDFTQRNREPYTVRFYKFYPNLLVGERTIQNKYLMCPVRLNVDLPEGYKNSVVTLYLLSIPILWQVK